MKDAYAVTGSKLNSDLTLSPTTKYKVLMDYGPAVLYGHVLTCWLKHYPDEIKIIWMDHQCES